MWTYIVGTGLGIAITIAAVKLFGKDYPPRDLDSQGSDNSDDGTHHNGDDDPPSPRGN